MNTKTKNNTRGDKTVAARQAIRLAEDIVDRLNSLHRAVSKLSSSSRQEFENLSIHRARQADEDLKQTRYDLDRAESYAMQTLEALKNWDRLRKPAA